MKKRASSISPIDFLLFLLFLASGSPVIGETILINSQQTGSIASGEDARSYEFQGVAGEAVTIDVESTGGGLDPALTLFLQTGLTAQPRSSELAIQQQSAEEAGIVTESFAEPQSTKSVFVEIQAPADGTAVPIATSPGNVSIIGKAGVTGGGAPANLEIVIAFDISGSVSSNEYDLEVAGIRQILNALDPNNTGFLSAPVALVQFDSTATITSPLTRSRAQLEAGLTRLRSGGTSFDPALSQALTALSPSSPSDSTSEIVLFFSDGAGSLTNPGGGGPLDTMTANKIVISTFGIGTGVSTTALTTMAQATGGTYTAIPTFQEVPLVTGSLPGVVGLASVTIDLDGDGLGDVNASVGVDGTWEAIVPISIGTNTLTAIATATDATLLPATDTVTVIGVLSSVVGNQIQVVHDDDSGAGNNARIEVFRLPASGTYTLLVTSSAKGGGGTAGNFKLSLKPVDENSNVFAVSRGSVPHVFSTLDGALRRAYGDSFGSFAPDGKTYVVFRGGVPHLFRTSDGALVRAYGDAFVAYSPKGDTYVVERGTVPHLFSCRDGRLIRAYGDQFVGYSPFGKYIAVTRGTVPHIFNAATGALIRAYGDRFVAFSPKGRYFAVTRGGVPHIFESQTGKLVTAYGDQFAAFAPDGGAFAVLRGGVPHVFESATGRLVRAYGDFFAAFAPDGKSYVVLRGGVPHLFRTADGALIRAYGDTFVSYSPHSYTYTVLRGGVPHLFSSINGALRRAYGDQFLSYAPNGATYVVARGGVPHLFSTLDGRLIRAYGDNLVGFSPTSESYVVLRGGVPHLFNTLNGGLIRAYGDEFVTFGPDGLSYAVRRGGVPFIFSTQDGKLLRAYGDRFISYGPLGKTFVVSRGGVPHLFDVSDGRLLRAYGDAFLGYGPTGDSLIVSRGGVPFLFDTSDGGLVRAYGDSFAGFSFDGMTYVVLRGGVPHLFNTVNGRLLRAYGDAFLRYSFDRTPDGTACIPDTNVLTDGSFEAGIPNPHWAETSTNFGTPLCTVADCGDAGGTSGPHNGSVWAWFGGISGTVEEGSLTQNVVIPAGSAELVFQLQVAACDSADDYLQVTVDGSQVYRINGGSALCGSANYVERNVDISTYADGKSHRLKFLSQTRSTLGKSTNFMVDSVEVNGCAP